MGPAQIQTTQKSLPDTDQRNLDELSRGQHGDQ
jgi:hypothetical protein